MERLSRSCFRDDESISVLGLTNKSVGIKSGSLWNRIEMAARESFFRYIYGSLEYQNKICDHFFFLLFVSFAVVL